MSSEIFKRPSDMPSMFCLWKFQSFSAGAGMRDNK